MGVGFGPARSHVVFMAGFDPPLLACVWCRATLAELREHPWVRAGEPRHVLHTATPAQQPAAQQPARPRSPPMAGAAAAAAAMGGAASTQQEQKEAQAEALEQLPGEEDTAAAPASPGVDLFQPTVQPELVAVRRRASSGSGEPKVRPTVAQLGA